MSNDLLVSKNEPDQRIVLEQYKILVESLNKLNDTRESSNTFWMGVNGLGISALAYLRDAQNIVQHHKPLLLVTLVVIGIFFCSSWLSYLWTIKKSIIMRSQLLVEVEKNFPVSIFSKIYTYSPEKSGRAGALTVKEMLVPYLFLTGYIFFAVLLFFYPEEVTSTPLKKQSSLNPLFQTFTAESRMPVIDIIVQEPNKGPLPRI